MNVEQERTAVFQVLHAVILMVLMNAHVQMDILVTARIAKTSTNVVMAVTNVTRMQIVSMSQWLRIVTVIIARVKLIISM